jgi:hypothetical protein
MAKKSRRARAKVRVNQQGSASESRIPSLNSVETMQKVAKPTTGGSPVTTLAGRHQHVIPELIRIGVISAVLFIIIIILSFVIV